MPMLPGDESVKDPYKDTPYNPFEVIHLDHIGPLPKDDHGYEYVLVLIDALSRWVELFPTKTTTALEVYGSMVKGAF
jgi:hypothetical protein